MHRLMLLRHAKSDRSAPGGRDHERPLNPRGRSDATRLGIYLVQHKLVPDQVIVSTAKRTQETWNLAELAFNAPPPARYEARLYEAGSDALMKVIQETAGSIGTLLLVGHNPGMQALASLLIAAGDLDARQSLNEHFPTAALAVIDFRIADWAELHPRAGRLDRFVVPRNLSKVTD
jgi:phosphohistidine phosphatase